MIRPPFPSLPNFVKSRAFRAAIVLAVVTLLGGCGIFGCAAGGGNGHAAGGCATGMRF